MHKHKGVERSNGNLRSHPISRAHKNTNVAYSHNRSLTSRQSKYKQAVLSTKGRERIRLKSKKEAKKELSKPKKETVTKIALRSKIDAENYLLDKDNYLYIDLEKSKAKGARIRFQRRQGNNKRIVGLQIEK